MDVVEPHAIHPPYVGILTVNDDKHDFRGNRKNFIDIIRAGKEVGIDIYVVTQQDLDLSSSKTEGYIYDFDKKRWKRQSLPLPQVIYNRVPNRNDELRPEVKQIIDECIKHPKIQIFNPA